MHIHNQHINVDNRPECTANKCYGGSEHWFSEDGCCLATCPIYDFPEEPTRLYKVVIGEDVADEILEHAAMFYNLPYAITFGRKSPMAVYVELTDRDAIDIAEHSKDITITRAPEGWSI